MFFYKQNECNRNWQITLGYRFALENNDITVRAADDPARKRIVCICSCLPNPFRGHCGSSFSGRRMKNKDRPSAVLVFQKVSMEGNESQKDGCRPADPCPPDPDTEPAKWLSR